MPLAVGHFAVGLLVNSAIEKPKLTTNKRLPILFLLVNCPDVDVLISWLATGSFYTYHRTFSHSVLFTVFVAGMFSNLYKVFPSFPKLSYKWCYWMVMSHLVADYLITPWEVAFLWPLPVWPPGSLNGILDHVPRYSSFLREGEVILICLGTYSLMKILGVAVNYLQKRLMPA